MIASFTLSSRMIIPRSLYLKMGFYLRIQQYFTQYRWFICLGNPRLSYSVISLLHIGAVIQRIAEMNQRRLTITSAALKQRCRTLCHSQGMATSSLDQLPPLPCTQGPLISKLVFLMQIKS